MSGIRIVPDVAAPLTVVAVDLVTEQTVPEYNEYAGYALAALGYGMAWFGKGGDFVKNVGIAAAPWAAKSLYERFVKGSGAARRVAVRTAGRAVTTAKPQFRGTRLI